jgi:outer membrane protein
MAFRHTLLIGLGLGVVAVPSQAQQLPEKLPTRPAIAPAPKPVAAPVVHAQVAQAPPNKPLRPLTASASSGVPRTLAEALAATYSNQPALQAERAKLRAADEGVPTALAGWRPTIILAGTAGIGDGVTRTYNSASINRFNLDANGNPTNGLNSTNQTTRDFATAQATVTQNLYTGGRTQASINRAQNLVKAERATLIAQEQTSFINTVTGYIGVIQARQLLELNINNEQVLGKQLQATNDRFRVGEITRTDVAQAEAAQAGARANRETAMGNLLTAKGTFQQIVGYAAPDDLIEPQPLALPVKSQLDATALAANNNPTVLTAVFNDAAAKDAVDIAFGALLPQVSLQGQTFQQINQASRNSSATGYVVTANVSVPVYQGGAEHSAVRQARQTQQQTDRAIDDARRTAVQSAVQAWSTLEGARSAAASTRAQIRANEIALEGVVREAIVGSRTTLDVLNAQQTLLNSRTSLVQNLSQLVTASYQVAAAIGRLTARDMHLPVPLYDETAYYQAVRNKWVGLGDYATDQPGR